MYRVFIPDHDVKQKNWDNTKVVFVQHKTIPKPSGLDVYVEKDGLPHLIIRLYYFSNEYYFRSEAILWHEFAAIGDGERLYLVPVEASDVEATVIDLGGYFGYLYPTEEHLLVASARHLFAVTATGDVAWIASNVGIDGVTVEKVEDGFVYGSGEFDPPGGWQKFRVRQRDGAIEVI